MRKPVLVDHACASTQCLNYLQVQVLILECHGFMQASVVNFRTVLRTVPGLSEPGVGSGWLRSSDGRGFSKRATAPTCLSRPGFQSRTEGSSRGATAGKAVRRETTSAEWAVLHGDDIR